MAISHDSPAGYYVVTIRPSMPGVLLVSNNERAFIVSQLQDCLSMRSILEGASVHHTLATHIDLLAFSVLSEAVQLLVFSISPASVQVLASSLLHRLRNYRGEWGSNHNSKVVANAQSISIHKLVGPHDALKLSTQIHLNHKDWESDRYSSIGFYLHDRRGDWMRVWRLSHLYDNNSENYYQLISSNLETSVHV